MRKDKKQIIGEPMTDEQIKVFLNVEPVGDTPAPLHKLMRAYHSLRIEDFERFLTFFKQQGYAFNTTNKEGKNFTALIADQSFSAPYIEAFKAIQTTT